MTICVIVKKLAKKQQRNQIGSLENLKRENIIFIFFFSRAARPLIPPRISLRALARASLFLWSAPIGGVPGIGWGDGGSRTKPP
jgi:hypothetical protein